LVVSYNQVQEVYNETRTHVTSPEITDRIREQFEKGIAEQLSIKVSQFLKFI
jgi:hypothetical protein